MDAVAQLLGSGMTDSEEIDQAVTAIGDSANGSSPVRYFAAVSQDGRVCGVMGLTAKNIDPELFKPTDKPVEFVHAHVDPTDQGSGVGTAMADHLKKIVQHDGYTKVIIVSGSRNREFGYPFWQGRYGNPARFDKDFWGPDNERVVWAKDLGSSRG
jgi:ribosomal protein S18 acetylase RimI-like enzyme